MLSDIWRNFINLGCDIHQYLRSFPSRRSSDLDLHGDRERRTAERAEGVLVGDVVADVEHRHVSGARPPAAEQLGRSEEHTSELQSQSNLVCRLLLEKTKPLTKP